MATQALEQSDKRRELDIRMAPLHPGNKTFLRPDFLGQLPLGNTFPAQSGFNLVDNLVIYHRNKDTDYPELDKTFKHKNCA